MADNNADNTQLGAQPNLADDGAGGATGVGDFGLGAPAPVGNNDGNHGNVVTTLEITIAVPDLRNGDVQNINQAAPKSSIAAPYKWAHIQGLQSHRAVEVVDAVIRAQYAQILSAGTAHPSEAERRDARTKAIILGAVRAGAAAAYRLVPNDMNAMEVVGSGTSITHHEIGATVTAGNGTAAPKHAVALSMAALTALEVKVVGTLLYLGMAVPAMQGISLVISGHHYLPTTKNTFAGMKRQALQVGGTEVTAWAETVGEVFDDMAFHKACHPISPPRKRSWAKSTDLAVRLTASGHGAAAIRLPALPSDAQGGKAALAVIKKAAPVIQGMGHTVSWDRGTELVRAVELAPEGRRELDAVAAVRNWMDANAVYIAFCAGIVQTLAEAGTGQQETTLRAFSMKKVMSENTAAAVRGNTYCRAYNTRMRMSAESGTFEDPRINL